MNGSQPVRCGWATGASPRERAYHDEEWGVVSRDEHTLYEFLVLRARRRVCLAHDPR